MGLNYHLLRIGGTLMLTSIAFSASQLIISEPADAKGGSMTRPHKRNVKCKVYTTSGCCIREECFRLPRAANKHFRSGSMPCLCPIFALTVAMVSQDSTTKQNLYLF
uniref:Secreted protein n=1 Tax=Glossina pallidipes TaxID=7398 RepID=A0A1B0A2Y5_GLOPL